MAYAMDTKGRQKSKGGKQIVAAIDIGTTYSGYAFSFEHDFKVDPTKVHANTNWVTVGAGLSLISPKTPTILLLNKDKTFKAFGYEAEDGQLATDEELEDVYYFKSFKMMLYNSLELKRDIEITDSSGRKMKAVKVFSIAIKYLKDHLMGERLKTIIPDVHDNDIRWVLTVPAIWNDSSKQLMRDAAELAGIQKENLIIVLEPDAASLFCMHLPVDRMKMEGGLSDCMLELPFSKGKTVDITIQEVIDSHKPNVLHSFGGAWGGTGVDAAYENFLMTIIGEKTYELFITDAEDRIDLLREFEIKKRNVRSENTGIATIKIPVRLKELYEETTGKRVKDRICEIPEFKDKVKWFGDKIRLDVDIVKSWFDESCTDIVQLMTKIFQDDKSVGVNTILLVGGFSESQMLQEAMRRNFPDKRLIIPDDRSLVVLKGATIFGHTV